MSQVKKVFKNTNWLFISQIIASICGFVWTILITRYLGVENYGIIGFATSFTGILAFTMDWGISTHIVRHVATDYESAPKYLGNAIPLKSIFTIGTILLTLVILILMKCDSLIINITILFTIETIIKTFVALFNGVFQAFEEMKYQGIENTLLSILLLIFIFITIFTDWGIYGIAISYIVANLIALIYAYYVMKKHITKPKFELDIQFCKRLTLVSLPFAATGVLYTIYYTIDIVMLTNMIGNYATGIYNASYKLISFLTVFYTVYASVIFPVMSKYYKNDKKLLMVTFEKSLKYLMIIIIPIAVATNIYSLDIIQFIYGSEYAASAIPLSILIWTVCLLFISGITNNLLLASYKEMTVTKFYIIAAIFNICLNFIMIPYLSYNGAAITTVLSDILIVVMQIYVMYKLDLKPNKKLYFDLVKIIIGSSILGIALYILNLNMWVALPVGIIIYFVVVYLIKLFDDDDIYVIKEILGKN